MKKLLAFFIVVSLCLCNFSFIYADDLIQDDTPDEASSPICFESKYRVIDNIVNQFNRKKISKMHIDFFSRQLPIYTVVYFEDGDYSKNVLTFLSFMEELLDISTGNQADAILSETEYLERYDKSQIISTGALVISPEISTAYAEYLLTGNKLKFGGIRTNSYAYVQNPEKAIEYALESIESGILKDMVVINGDSNIEHEVLSENFRYDPVNYDITAPREKIVYRLQDKIEFDIVPDESYYDTVFEDVGELGEPVRITIENIQGGTRFVLTIEGSKAIKKFWTEEDGWDFKASNTENGLVFSTAEYIKGNTQYRIIDRGRDKKSYGIVESPKIAFNGNVSDGKISTVKMKMSFRGVSETNIVSASDIQYTYYGNEKKYRLDEKVSLIRKFGIDRSAAAIRLNRQQGENFLEQDTENWKTDLRYEDDEVEFDFSVSYAAKVRLNNVSGNVSAWLKKLGTKPELTIIGLNTTCNGEENINYPIVKFTGNGKTQWFAMSKMSDSKTDSSLDDSTICVRFNSMKSFDNFIKIENLEDYHTIKMYLHYNKAGNVEELGSIDLVISENKTITILADEIDSILGGEKIYESWM